MLVLNRDQFWVQVLKIRLFCTVEGLGKHLRFENWGSNVGFGSPPTTYGRHILNGASFTCLVCWFTAPFVSTGFRGIQKSGPCFILGTGLDV